jgi:hypothetical protein
METALIRQLSRSLARALTRVLMRTLTRVFSVTFAATLIVPAPMWAGVKATQVQVIASTEIVGLREQSGTLSFPEGNQLAFLSDVGEKLTIPCSAITHTSFRTKSKMLKKVAVPAVAAAIFTMGLSLFALAIRGHGYFLAVDYGDKQQAIFSMGKDVYAQDVNATSACTGKPTEILR